MLFKGRGLREALPTITTYPDGTVSVRVDCGRDPEYWSEHVYTAAELEIILASARASRASESEVRVEFGAHARESPDAREPQQAPPDGDV